MVQAPPLALVGQIRRSAGATRWVAPGLADASHGLAWVAWQEGERAESSAVAVGAVTPAALLMEVGR